MFDLGDATKISVSTALRDLADRIDAGHDETTVVCVIGTADRAKVFALSGNLPTILGETAALLEGIVAGLATADQKRAH